MSWFRRKPTGISAICHTCDTVFAVHVYGGQKLTDEHWQEYRQWEESHRGHSIGEWKR